MKGNVKQLHKGHLGLGKIESLRKKVKTQLLDIKQNKEVVVGALTGFQESITTPAALKVHCETSNASCFLTLPISKG